MKKLLLLIVIAVSSSLLQAQVNIQVGTGTGSSSNVPLTTNYGYNYTQSIYLASDITAAGGVPTYIHKIRYYTTSNPPANSDGWTIYMKNTTKTTFASNTDWEAGATLTQVFSGTVTFPAANSWMEITLTTPFLWDGTSNIAVAVDENVSNWGSLSSWRTTPSAPDYRSIYYRNDNTNPDPNTPPTATGRTQAAPNIQFEMYNGSCSGTPVHDVVQVNNASICIGNPLTFTTDANNLEVGIDYLWQYNTGAGWTNFTTSINSWTFTTSELTQSADVRAVVTCTSTSATDTADPVHVTINPLPVITLNENSFAYCPGGVVALTASGATNYSWSPATDLDNTNQPAVNSTPTADIMYTVTGTDGNGCSSSATVSLVNIVNVSPVVSYTPQYICAPGTPITISLTGVPAALSAGNFEYQFVGPDTTTVLQAWSTSSTYNFTPAADSLYAFFYQVRSSACPAEVNDSARIAIPVGFGASVSTIEYNCLHPGSFTLSDIFGQEATDTVYTNTLDNPANVTNLSFSGVASITGGRAVLTPSATGVSGYMLIDADTFNFGYHNSLHVSFLMTNDQPINNYGTGGADGITYSFGDDAIPSSNGNPPNGKGTKLRLCFDSANNGSENGNATGIYLVYGWTANNAYGPASAQVLAYSSNTSLWKTKTDVPVDFSIDFSGMANLVVDGVTVFENIQMPAAYMNSDASNWYHLFSAGTGGDALRQAISDLNIESNTLDYGIATGSASTPPSQWQSTPSFTNLQPGLYTLWMSNPDDHNCNANLGVYEILNINPVVDLGNDTIVCAGSQVILDAGNPGADYNWSTQDTTQMIIASQIGAYAVSVTDPVGCSALGTINIGLAPSPAATGIYASGMFPTVFYSVLNPVNANHYNWNFGDGNLLMNGPSTVGHTYANMNTYNVSVTISNEFNCDSVTLTRSVTVNNNQLDIENIESSNVQIYPNPASVFVNIMMDDYSNSNLTVYTVSGAEVYSAPLTQSVMDVSNLVNGVYIFRIMHNDHFSMHRVVVNH